MFWKRNKIKKDMIGVINPTSKASLKMQCLLVSNGDIDKAERLYDFIAKDMPDLPTYDPIRPTTMQQVKDTAVQAVSWINENQENIVNWVSTIKSLFGKGNIPSQGHIEPIPPIN